VEGRRRLALGDRQRAERQAREVDRQEAGAVQRVRCLKPMTSRTATGSLRPASPSSVRATRRRSVEPRSTAKIAAPSVAATVERHRENILAKLGMRDRVKLTRYAIRRGLVEP
jgi:hypothetical protein